MATLTIRNVPENIKHTLRVKAAQSGQSLEESLRQIVSNEAMGSPTQTSRINADEIMRRAAELETDKPTDERYKYLTQKEISDAISGEYDGL